MSTVHTSDSTETSRFCHVAKGLGYFGLTVLSSLAVVTIVAIVVAGALACIATFLHSIYLGTLNPVCLVWTIPVSLILCAIDSCIVSEFAKCGEKAIPQLKEAIVEMSNKMVDHFDKAIYPRANLA